MRYKLSKTIMDQPERIREISWQFSEGSTWKPSSWQQRNTNPRNLSSIQQIKLGRFSSWTSKTGQRRIRSSCPCHRRTIHICQSATTTEKVNESGPFGDNKQIVTHLEKELELNGLEAPDELQINTVSQQPKNTNADRPKPMCHHCKKPVQYRNQCRSLKKQLKKSEDTQNNPVNKKSGANNSKQETATSTIIITTKTTKTVTEPRKAKNCLPILWDMWKNKSLHRETKL